MWLERKKWTILWIHLCTNSTIKFVFDGQSSRSYLKVYINYESSFIETPPTFIRTLSGVKIILKLNWFNMIKVFEIFSLTLIGPELGEFQIIIGWIKIRDLEKMNLIQPKNITIKLMNGLFSTNPSIYMWNYASLCCLWP